MNGHRGGDGVRLRRRRPTGPSSPSSRDAWPAETPVGTADGGERAGCHREAGTAAHTAGRGAPGRRRAVGALLPVDHRLSGHRLSPTSPVRRPARSPVDRGATGRRCRGGFASLERCAGRHTDPRFSRTGRYCCCPSAGWRRRGRTSWRRSGSTTGRQAVRQSLIAVVQGEKAHALTRGGRGGRRLSRTRRRAWIALSYAQQASFDLDGARRSLEEAVKARSAERARPRAPGGDLALVREGARGPAERRTRRRDSAPISPARRRSWASPIWSGEAPQGAGGLRAGDRPRSRGSASAPRARARPDPDGRPRRRSPRDRDRGRPRPRQLARRGATSARPTTRRSGTPIAVEEFARAKTLDPTIPRPGSTTPSRSRASTGRWRRCTTCSARSS